MNKDQTTGVAERLIYAAAMAVLAKLVGKGYLDQDTAAYLAAGIVTLVGSAWAFYINRPQALAASLVNAAPGTKIVTNQALAQAVPGDSVVSNTDVKVVPR